MSFLFFLPSYMCLPLAMTPISFKHALCELNTWFFCVCFNFSREEIEETLLFQGNYLSALDWTLKSPWQTSPQIKCWKLEGHESSAKSTDQILMNQVKLSLRVTSLSWNYIDWPPQWRIMLLKTWVELISNWQEGGHSMLHRYCLSPYTYTRLHNMNFWNSISI